MMVRLSVLCAVERNEVLTEFEGARALIQFFYWRKMSYWFGGAYVIFLLAHKHVVFRKEGVKKIKDEINKGTSTHTLKHLPSRR